MITTKDVSITEGADAGKVFVVQKMSLEVGDTWANRVALALLKSGVDISGLIPMDENGKPVFRGMIDMVGIVNVALKALGGVDEEVAQALLKQVLTNVKIRLPNGTERSAIMETDITEIGTLWKLRIEAIKVNLDFLTAGVMQ